MSASLEHLPSQFGMEGLKYNKMKLFWSSTIIYLINEYLDNEMIQYIWRYDFRSNRKINTSKEWHKFGNW